MSSMTEEYDPWKDRSWFGMEFTKTGGAVMMILLLIYLPMHEFGHFIAYWICGIPAEFGIIYDPFMAITVRCLIIPDMNIKIFASFFGGGFVFIIDGIVAIRIRPSLIASVAGLCGGLTEVAFFILSNVQQTVFVEFVAINFAPYLILQTLPIMILFIFGLPEVQWWLHKSR
jgi:hypothetical protein